MTQLVDGIARALSYRGGGGQAPSASSFGFDCEWRCYFLRGVIQTGRQRAIDETATPVFVADWRLQFRTHIHNAVEICDAPEESDRPSRVCLNVNFKSVGVK